MHLGWQEVIVIALVILLLLGGSAKLPDLARSLGKAMKEFKKAIKDVQCDDDEQSHTGTPHD